MDRMTIIGPVIPVATKFVNCKVNKGLWPPFGIACSQTSLDLLVETHQADGLPRSHLSKHWPAQPRHAQVHCMLTGKVHDM